MHDDWDQISASTQESVNNIRRADPKHPLDFWRGRDHLGRYLFIVEGPAPAEGFPSQGPAGIDIAHTDIGNGNCRLTLTLVSSEAVELFRTLCRYLLKETEATQAEQRAQGVSLVLTHIERWQDLLARRRNNLLTLQQMIGLFGELIYMRDQLLPGMPAMAAVSAWRGPYGDEQDFLIGDTIFEIKTQLATSDRRIQISSEDQLDTISGKIVLCVQRLSVALSSETGASLNQTVLDIRNDLSKKDTGALALFDLGLIEAGHEARPEYDHPLWVLNERLRYEVREGFPRIIRAALAPGVDLVRYSIQLSACQNYLINENIL